MSIVSAVGQMMRRGLPGPAAAGVMYLGGFFNGVNAVRSSTRNRAAAVDADVDADVDAMVEAWDPNCGSDVRAMILSGADMYLGGSFTTVGGTTRNRAACVDSDVTQANPTLRAWNPNCSNQLFVMVLSGADLYLGGSFTTVRGTERNRAACVDSDPAQENPDLRAWNPNCGGTVYTMILNGADLYLGGNFTTIRGTARNRAACVASDPTQANPDLRDWNPDCNAVVYTMLLNGDDMYLGGNFSSVSGGTRNRAACVASDPTQANPDLRAWNLNCDGTVWTMVLNGADLYLGGTLETVRGSTRNRAACVDSDPTQANPDLRAWNPNCGGTVYTMLLNGDDMYLVGGFTTVRGTTRNCAACVDSDPTQENPALRAWNPNCSIIVWTMVLA